MIKKRKAVDADYDDLDWKIATEFGPVISHLAVVQCGLETFDPKTKIGSGSIL